MASAGDGFGKPPNLNLDMFSSRLVELGEMVMIGGSRYHLHFLHIRQRNDGCMTQVEPHCTGDTRQPGKNEANGIAGSESGRMSWLN